MKYDSFCQLNMSNLIDSKMYFLHISSYVNALFFFGIQLFIYFVFMAYCNKINVKESICETIELAIL